MALTDGTAVMALSAAVVAPAAKLTVRAAPTPMTHGSLLATAPLKAAATAARLMPTPLAGASLTPPRMRPPATAVVATESLAHKGLSSLGGAGSANCREPRRRRLPDRLALSKYWLHRLNLLAHT